MECPTETYVLSKLERAVEIGREMRRYWFRGHPMVHGELKPGIYRDPFLRIASKFSGLRYLEVNATRQFRRTARTLSGTLPQPDNHVDWLVFMQHYGLPTRLLDWTESALVGLFFAVRSDFSEDGELWAMFPPALNRLTGGPKAVLPLPGEPNLTYLASEPMGMDGTKLLERLGLDRTPRAPVAFEPTLWFPRMAAQLSTFTIHPDPTYSGQFLQPDKPVDLANPEKPHTVTTGLRNKSHLVRYIIPASSKKTIWEELGALGINERSLFQDLEGLSRDIRAELLSERVYEESIPPVADGRWES